MLHGHLTGYFVVATSLCSRGLLLLQVDTENGLCIKKFLKVLVIQLKRFIMTGRGQNEYIIQEPACAYFALIPVYPLLS